MYEFAEPEVVTVPAEWIAKAKEFGTQRDALNGGNDTPAYAHNGPLPYSSLTASRLAVLAEVAVHFYLGVDPEATVFVVDRTAANYQALKAAADLEWHGRKIEVRNSTRETSPIPIKEKDVAANAIVIQAHVVMKDGRPTGEVKILGWADAAKDYERCFTKRAGTAYKVVKKPLSRLGDAA